MRHHPARALSLPLLRALARPLALAATLAASLAACNGLDSGPDNGGNSDTGLRIGILTRPSVTPRPGDTLTFYVTFPDSTNERVLIAWTLDTRGKRLPGDCTRAVCAK